MGIQDGFNAAGQSMKQAVSRAHTARRPSTANSVEKESRVDVQEPRAVGRHGGYARKRASFTE